MTLGIALIVLPFAITRLRGGDRIPAYMCVGDGSREPVERDAAERLRDRYPDRQLTIDRGPAGMARPLSTSRSSIPSLASCDGSEPERGARAVVPTVPRSFADNDGVQR